MTSERAALADYWLARVNAAFEVYKRARDFRQCAQDEAPHLPQSDGGIQFRRALMAETEALAGYRIALAAHFQILVKGEKPA